MKITQLREIERRLVRCDASLVQIARDIGVDIGNVNNAARKLGHKRQVIEQLRHMVRMQDAMLALRNAPTGMAFRCAKEERSI